MLTADGENRGVFSVDSARRLIDRYAEELPPDSIRKYGDVILGFNLADDYGCCECWGGRAIRQSEIAEWADYARTGLPGVALGVRVEPRGWRAVRRWRRRWTTPGPSTRPGSGEPKAYFDKPRRRRSSWAQGGDGGERGELLRSGQRRLLGGGPRAVRDGGGDAPGELRVHQLAVQPARWEDPAVRAAWEGLFALARGRTAVGCGRA